MEYLKISNKGFFYLLCYIFFMWFINLSNEVLFFLKLSQNNILIIFFILFISLFFTIRLKKNVEFCDSNINLFLKISWIIIFAYSFFKGIIPDTSADTTNFHISMQNPQFNEKFGINIVSGDSLLISYSFVDTLFYIPRIVLGYRMGTMINTVFLILIHYSIFGILKNNLRKRKIYVTERKLDIICSFGSLVVISNIEIFMQVSTYMSELILLLISVEIIRLLLNNNYNKFEVYYFCILNGILFMLKITSIIYIIPFVFIYLFKIRKSLKIKLFLKCFLIVIIINLPMFIFNYFQSGNPVFPFFNSFFKSPYYFINNFKDTRWGPQNIKEILFWPLYVAFFPNYRHGEVTRVFSFITCVMIIFNTLYVFNLKKISNEKRILFILFWVSFYFWAFLIGHNRYFITGFSIGTLLFMINVIEYFYFKNDLKKINKYILRLLIFCCSIEILLNSFIILIGKEYSWRENLNLRIIKENCNLVFKDRKIFDITCSNGIKSIVSFNDLGGLGSSLNDGIPIIRMKSVEQYEEKSQNIVKRNINILFNNGGVYDLIVPHKVNIDEYIDRLNKHGFKISDIKSINSIFKTVDEISLVKFDKLNKNEQNSIIKVGEKIDFNNKGNLDLSAIVYLPRAHNYIWSSHRFVLRITELYSKKDSIIFLDITSDADATKINKSLELEKGKKYSLQFDIVDSNENIKNKEFEAIIKIINLRVK